MLDYLQGMLSVDWRWEEGNKDQDGNIQVDYLAKKGISAEFGLWQDIAYSMYDRCDDGAFSTQIIQ